MRRLSSLRARLAFSLTSVLVLSLGVYAVGIYAVLSRHVYRLLDLGLHEEVELMAHRLEVDAQGGVRWAGGNEPALVEEEPGGAHWIEVRSPEGVVLFEATSATGRPHISLPFSPTADDPYSLQLPGGLTVRTLTEPARVGQRRLLVQAARSEQPVRAHLRDLLFGLGVLFPLVLVVFGGLGHLLVGRLLAPLNAMAHRSQQITAERLSERLPLSNPDDELGQLGTAFNDTLARLERSFDQLQRFTDDASHELRTPLTALRSVGEVGLTGSHDEAGYREIIGSMLEETDRLTHMVDTLLTLARADAGSIKIHRDDVDVAALVREVVSQLSVLAEERGQQLITEGAASLRIRGDRVVLYQAIVNLVDNAIKYGPSSSVVRVAVSQRQATARIEVSDQGPGIPPSHRDRIFDRFYRVDKGRSRQLGGAGLGLSLVKWAAEVHGGTVELDTVEGGGSTFRLVIPAVTPA